MTAQASKGRPVSADTAQKRFGIKHRPQMRITARINKGHPVKKNKVIGGEPGYGEITSPKRISPSQILRIDPLK